MNLTGLAKLWRNSAAWIGGGMLLAALIIAAFAPLVAPYGPNETVGNITEPPTRAHWLGTDFLRKDVLSRVIYGSRLSLAAACLSVLLATLIGLPLGAAAGYWGGPVDTLLMRGIDVALAFPSVLIALLVATALRPGWGAIILAVGLINVPVFARQIRASVLTVRNLDYVLATRAFGATSWHILSHTILPSLVSPTIVLASLLVGSAILEVAGLSFLGIGGDPTEPEWGSMLAQAKDYLGKNPWFAAGPGAAISLTVLGCNLLGDALRDALEVRK
jgi:peptide/nickel transport system permease protein